ncbi:MAG: HAMP domain-containing sensor histidine kinase [Eubacteriales bacterium]|nr:HAMP domain-containing sensor histidine kinase [Eubacteriales bacterium]
MKSKYKKLKRAILVRTLLAAAAALAVGVGIVRFFHNENYCYALLAADFVVMAFVIYRLLAGWMMRYLRSAEKAIETLSGEEESAIALPKGLEPMEERLNELKNTIRQEKQDGLDGEQRKNDLVLYLAHDLKTPLTSIIAYLTMLDGKRDMSEEDREKFTHIALEKATRLGELVSEFFEIAKFNLQKIELEKEPLDLSVMLEQLADESYGVLQEKYLSCYVDAQDDLMVYGDPDKLARVFDNLLRNAITYSYRDTAIQILARKIGTQIQISFINQGHQIPKQKLDVIFEKFYRVDNARSSQTGGAGLGLAIAKQIVDLHQGRIEAASDRVQTSFTVWLPSIEAGQPGVLQPEMVYRNAVQLQTGQEISKVPSPQQSEQPLYEPKMEEMIVPLEEEPVKKKVRERKRLDRTKIERTKSEEREDAVITVRKNRGVQSSGDGLQRRSHRRIVTKQN